MGQLERVKMRLGTDLEEVGYEDALIEDVLESAKGLILARRYPFGEIPEDTDADMIRYADLQVRMAVEMLSRIGFEGETQHTENGVTRIFEDRAGVVSNTLLREVTPKAGLIFR